MKSFRFTLQAVQTLRQSQEQKAREDYARALLAHRQALERLKQVEAEVAHTCAQITAQLSAGLAAARLAQLHFYAASLEEGRKKCSQTAATLGAAAQHAAQLWQTARRQCEVVEKCRLRQKKVYQRAVLVHEQKLLDELAHRNREGASLMEEGQN